MNTRARGQIVTASFVVGGLFLVAVLNVAAQGKPFSIVSTYDIEDDIFSSGDIVIFDPDSSRYSLSRVVEDERMFGVIEEDPIVVFRTDDGGIPIAQLGEVFVNVTNVTGDIRVGDFITTSEIPGKAQRFDRETDGFVVGMALERFDESSERTIVQVNGEEVAVGSIYVLLQIGPYSVTNDGTDVVESLPPTVIVNDPVPEDERTLTPAMIFRFIVATLFAAASLFLVFKNFGPNLREGVISVGRNPLAKNTIQSMVTFNMLLIIILSVTSLLVSLAIILLPV